MKMNLEENKGHAEWQLMDDDYFHYIDANSGKFVRKENTD